MNYAESVCRHETGSEASSSWMQDGMHQFDCRKMVVRWMGVSISESLNDVRLTNVGRLSSLRELMAPLNGGDWNTMQEVPTIQYKETNRRGDALF